MKWTPDAGFWKRRNIPEPIREFRFCQRRWRFDFCWSYAFSECEGVKVGTQVALEVNGGIFIRGRHTRGIGQLNDMAKLNEAQRLGWKVFQFTPQQMLTEETSEFLRSVLIEER